MHDAAFRRAIGAAVGEGAHRLQRRDVDDAAPAPRDHRRHEALHEEERRIEIETHRPIPVLARELEHRLANVEPRRIDDDVRRAEEARRGPRARIDRVPIREIAGEHRRLVAARSDRIARRGELVLTPGDQDDARSGFGERPGDRAADPGASAGHQRDAAGEREQRRAARRRIRGPRAALAHRFPLGCASLVPVIGSPARPCRTARRESTCRAGRRRCARALPCLRAGKSAPPPARSPSPRRASSAAR